jgi:hypothetical protein
MYKLASSEMLFGLYQDRKAAPVCGERLSCGTAQCVFFL